MDWLLKDENNINSSDMLFYVIFEADGWPAVRQTREFDIPALPNLKPKIRYRSWEAFYDARIVSQGIADANFYGIPYANSLNIDNDYITYNLKLK